MSEYYDYYSERYIELLKKPVVVYDAKILSLTHYESATDDITNDCILKDSSVSINNSQGCRRSCTLKFQNTSGKYTPDPNKLLWYNKKLKVYKGVVDTANSDTYWWSQGIFVVTSFEVNNDEVTVECSDKYAFLNGDLRLSMYDVAVQIPDTDNMYLISPTVIAAGNGLSLRNIIFDLIMADMGNNTPLDPTDALLDTEFENLFLDYQISVGNGNYPADIISNLAEMYRFNTYYNIEGHLKVTKFISDEYYNITPIWFYDDTKIGGSNISVTYDHTKATNVQRVSGNNIEGNVYSYTAKNTNLISPINIYLVGEKEGEEIEIENGNSAYKCQQRAEYELKYSTMNACSVSLDGVPLPHIDVDVPIIVNSPINSLNNTRMVVTDVTIPLGVGEMSLSLTNVNYIPLEASCTL